MNLRFLGDALDHWKGSLLFSLASAEVIHNLAVDSVASDWESWTSEDLKLFFNLLRLEPVQILTHHAPLCHRSDYFAEISHAGDCS